MDFTLAFITLFLWSIYVVGPLLLTLAGTITVLGQIVTLIERWNKFDGLYWSFITATTVGYGDIRPMKKISKVLSVLIALIGMIFTGIIIGISLHTVDTSIQDYLDPEMVSKIQESAK